MKADLLALNQKIPSMVSRVDIDKPRSVVDSMERENNTWARGGWAGDDDKREPRCFLREQLHREKAEGNGDPGVEGFQPGEHPSAGK